MARITYALEAIRDLQRLDEFLSGRDSAEAAETFLLIDDAVQVLGRHPLIGRGSEDFRELLISRGRSGYVALYEYDEAADEVLVLRVRHQREAGIP